ncbi:hypothetical protein [Caulobacter sp. RHG1]|uniref:hypothetical protein n=1 Tax=Caulobacter sp. (strain RHG1) TaxID=2545762 RepID=UPI001555B448|nr:hypothetical protein [Caulobacter sp. RHG1]NQE63739.1 hypothetical protein [Caulobacter sp. RHG1]
MSQARALYRLNGQRLRARVGGPLAPRVAPPQTAAIDPATLHDVQRPSVVERCEQLGVRLTEKRRRLAEVLDMVPSPIDLEAVWWKAVELQIDVNRSSLHRMCNDLVEVGVLNEIGLADRRGRYATPPAVSLAITTAEGETVSVSDDATLVELLIEALARTGIEASGRRIIVSVED